MDQKEIDEINKNIPFVDAKIYWDGSEWTSPLWERLSKIGWKIFRPEEDSEMVVIQDDTGRTLNIAQNRLEMLKQLVNIAI
ncbi:hypothetical protein [Pelotomaculum propionicicum]|uniref:Uncharacterized protein n=1 Tax=Pelotomaculum propionicicum TaxID=258475 RepID=A0A4Y7RKM8_9FIRM|nr:hypothetical protein [Pelotomaculum propionicicum]NLI14481.1 hypothetical protein [Peptococcaceae bacterium]TEB09558.1 hypothetical protein Pmgp_03054 [Pelotomaculum propionicicum]